MKKKLISLALVLSFAFSLMTVGASVASAEATDEKMATAVENFIDDFGCNSHPEYVHVTFSYASTFTKEALGKLFLEAMELSEEKYSISIDDEAFNEIAEEYGGSGDKGNTWPGIETPITVTNTETGETSEEIVPRIVAHKYFDNTKPWISVCKDDVEFSDIQKFGKKNGYEAWYYDVVTYAIKNGLMNGTSSGRVKVFEPNAPMTRAMFVTVLYRAEGEPVVTPKKPQFCDITPQSWYENAVIWAAENELVNGFPGGTFAPDEKITREQMSKLIANYVDFAKITLPEPDEDKVIEFTDAAQIQGWAVEYVEKLAKAGIVNGKEADDGSFSFDPKETLSRAQAAALIARIDRLK